MKPTAAKAKRFKPCHGPAADPGLIERRQQPRYLIARPVLVVPVLPDLSPDWQLHAEGVSVDVSEGGMRFQIPTAHRFGTKRLMIGVETDTEEMHFAAAEVRNRQTQDSCTSVGAMFSRGEQDWLREEKTMPTLSPSTFRYETKIPPDVLAKWCTLGIMRPVLLDRLVVCPECKAIPTFRTGCPNCGSSRLASAQLIHHFACAHVGLVPDFVQAGEVACPKCRTRNLVVGTDFEYLQGPQRCIDCNWSGSKLVQVAQCVMCGLRFPGHQAEEMELIGYHVHRLDPLALVECL
jgi:hypothetical protein